MRNLPRIGSNPIAIKCLHKRCKNDASHGRSVCPYHWEQLLSVYFDRPMYHLEGD